MIDNYFVCIGAQKSGTTWLARILAAHPELFLTPVKEIHYFDHIAGITDHLNGHKRRSRYRRYHQHLWTEWRRFADNRARWGWYRDYMRTPIDDAWYARLFTHRGGKRFAGEVTPEYALLGRDGFAHMHRLAPAARILFIMRNPVAQAWSQALHHARANGLDTARMPPDALIALLRQPRIAALGDYAATLRALAEVFPAEQILALYYEDMHADRAAAVAQVCRFIGIGFDAAWFPELAQRHNRSQEAPLPEPVRAYLVEECRPRAVELRARLGRIPADWRAGLGL